MNNKILILAAVLALVSCGGNAQRKTAAADTQKAAAAAPDMHTAETSLDYQGTYRGTLPAADCPGIEVTRSRRIACAVSTPKNSWSPARWRTITYCKKPPNKWIKQRFI